MDNKLVFDILELLDDISSVSFISCCKYIYDFTKEVINKKKKNSVVLNIIPNEVYYSYPNNVKEGLWQCIKENRIYARCMYKNGIRCGLYEEYFNMNWTNDRFIKSYNHTIQRVKIIEDKMIINGSSVALPILYKNELTPALDKILNQLYNNDLNIFFSTKQLSYECYYENGLKTSIKIYKTYEEIFRLLEKERIDIEIYNIYLKIINN